MAPFDFEIRGFKVEVMVTICWKSSYLFPCKKNFWIPSRTQSNLVWVLAPTCRWSLSNLGSGVCVFRSKVHILRCFFCLLLFCFVFCVWVCKYAILETVNISDCFYFCFICMETVKFILKLSDLHWITVKLVELNKGDILHLSRSPPRWMSTMPVLTKSEITSEVGGLETSYCKVIKNINQVKLPPPPPHTQS